jgi:hypothetical protein
MAKKGKGMKKPVAELTDDEVVQLVVDVVRRLRRVALHPLARDSDNPRSMTHARRPSLRHAIASAHATCPSKPSVLAMSR